MSLELDPGLFSPDVREFFGILRRHGVRYLLIGGHAVFLHGYPRLTADVDLAYACGEENVERLFAALLEFWGGAIPNVQAPAELAVRGVVVQFGRPPNRLDLLSAPDGLDFDAAWERRVTASVGDLLVEAVALVDLRAMKAAAGRAKDLDDLDHLPLP